MTNNRTILITGVTGNQGGAVAQALQSSGFRLRGLTRKAESERAAALAHHGADEHADNESFGRDCCRAAPLRTLVPKRTTLVSDCSMLGVRRSLTCYFQEGHESFLTVSGYGLRPTTDPACRQHDNQHQENEPAKTTPYCWAT